MPRCVFFASGRACRHGDSCRYLHVDDTISSTSKAFDVLSIRFPRATDNRASQVCKYFILGTCIKDESCEYAHPPALAPLPTQNLQPHQSQSDSRQKVHCKFQLSHGGCQNSSCPYLHDIDSSKTGELGTELSRDEVGLPILNTKVSTKSIP